ncbi:MAG: porphobilinogen synthase [Candidatus Zixiibacteriota bacterium]|nr:MAG: porphobilinogen synthase [candidate division Zixibacteria bacterium]
MSFPINRPRRLRQNRTIRRLIRENSVSVDDLVQPLFVVPGNNVKAEIGSMPGQYHLSVDQAAKEASRISSLGIPAVILFGIPEKKDNVGSEAYAENGIIQKAVKEIKKSAPDLLVITDVCLCEYTDHGHCGVVKDKQVANDPTLELLAKTALSHARAGADIVAPSDMMDGRVGAIRNALDDNGFNNIPILSYAVKYASAYYGPFRNAAGSAPRFGDRKGYQMDPANAFEAIREAELDIDEGADMIMVKPGIAYLDILNKIKQKFGRVTAVYQVSGEYAMIEAAGKMNLIDRKAIIMETLLSFKRAGADFILTYYASEVAGWLSKIS